MFFKGPTKFTLIISILFKCFIYFWERKRERMSREGAEREGDRGSEAGSLLTAESPMWGSNPRTVRPWPEPKSDAQPTEPPRRPEFIYFLRERQREWVGERQREREGEGGRERESQAGTTPSAWSLMWGSNSQNVRSWRESKPRVRHLTDWATQAPLNSIFKFLKI